MVSFGPIDIDKQYQQNAANVLKELSKSRFIETEGRGQYSIGTELQYRVDRFFRHTVGNRTETIPEAFFVAQANASVIQRILQQVLSEDPDFKDKNLRVTSEAGEALAEPGIIKAKFRIHTQDQPEELQAALQRKLSVLKNKINSLPKTTDDKRRR